MEPSTVVLTAGAAAIPVVLKVASPFISKVIVPAAKTAAGLGNLISDMVTPKLLAGIGWLAACLSGSKKALNAPSSEWTRDLAA